MPLWHVAVRVEGAAATSAVADVFDALTGAVSAFETREAAGTAPAEWQVETYAAKALVDAALDLRLTLAAIAAGRRNFCPLQDAPPPPRRPPPKPRPPSPPPPRPRVFFPLPLAPG